MMSPISTSMPVAVSGVDAATTRAQRGAAASVSDVGSGEFASPAREFESLIVAQLLKSMRSESEDGGMFPGDSTDSLGGMFDTYFSGFLSEHGGLGLAAELERGLDATRG